MASISVAEVQRNMANVTSVDSVTLKADRRAIVSFQDKEPELQPDDETIKLYLALLGLLKPMKKKVTAGVLKSWVGEAFVKESWNQISWVVPRFRQADLPSLTWWNAELRKEEKMKDYIIDPSSSAQPAGFDPTESWLVDDSVPKSVLGAGATSLILRAWSKRSVSLPPADLGPKAVEDTSGTPPDFSPPFLLISLAPTNSVESEGANLASKATPVFKAVPNDPDKKEPWPQRIGRRTVALAGEGKWAVGIPSIAWLPK